MQCDKIVKYVEGDIKENEFLLHRDECSFCYEMSNRLEDAFLLLDINEDVPKDLSSRILQKKNELPTRFSIRKDFALILQVACVAIAGIFLGIVLGKNSNPNVLMTKNTERTKTLIEYKHSHHFTVNRNLFK